MWLALGHLAGVARRPFYEEMTCELNRLHSATLPIDLFAGKRDLVIEGFESPYRLRAYLKTSSNPYAE
jgi:hypothetical protein